jgi:hypothetical protein
MLIGWVCYVFWHQKLLTAYRTRRDIIKLYRRYKTKVRPNQKDVSQLLDLEFQARRAFIDSNAKEQDRPTKIIQAYPCFLSLVNTRPNLK